MKRKAGILILSALFLSQLLSCSTRSGSIKRSLSYKELLEKNSVSGKEYDKFETKLIANATYKDGEFIEAQVREKGEKLLYDSGRVNYLVNEAKRENVFYVNFFVALYTPDERYADYSKKKGLWKFYIKKGNYELVEARDIIRIPRSDLPEYEALYPYLSSWTDSYKVTFARSDIYNSTNSQELHRPFSLLITGQLGRLELSFE